MHVEALNLFPIKSCGGLRAESLTIGEKGFLYDREWMIVRADGAFHTARQSPEMLTIRTSMLENCIQVEKPNDSNKLFLPFDRTLQAVVAETVPSSFSPIKDSKLVPGRVWKLKMEVLDMGDEPAEFFTSFLQKPVRIVRQAVPRLLGEPLLYPETQTEVSLADEGPYLLVSKDSLADLNTKLESPVPIDRFRANIVISGAEPWAEDGFAKIHIGNASFNGIACCGRCKMITIDHEQGKFTPKSEPLQTLSTFHRLHVLPGVADVGTIFGQHLSAETSSIGQSISTGASITIVQTKAVQSG